MKVIKFHNASMLYEQVHITRTIYKSIITHDYKRTFNIYFIKNGKGHNSKNSAEIEYDKELKTTFYYHFLYGKFYDVNNISWKKYAKDIVRQKKLKIFK